LSPSLLLRIRFSGFTHVFSLAMEYLGPLLGGIILATLVGLGASSFGRTTCVRNHYILNEENNGKYPIILLSLISYLMLDYGHGQYVSLLMIYCYYNQVRPL